MGVIWTDEEREKKQTLYGQRANYANWLPPQIPRTRKRFTNVSAFMGAAAVMVLMIAGAWQIGCWIAGW